MLRRVELSDRYCIVIRVPRIRTSFLKYNDSNQNKRLLLDGILNCPSDVIVRN